MRWTRTAAVMAWLLAGCGGTVAEIDAAPAEDAPPAVDAAGPADAGLPDAVPVASPPTVDLTSAGGRATGGAYTLDFQLGHSVDQGNASGGGTTLEGGAAIKP